MTEKLSAAIDALMEELEQQARAVAETKKMINSLRRRMGDEPMFPDESPEPLGGSSGIKPGSYYGKPLATAMADALRRRGSAATTEEILSDLRRGEFDFKGLGWQESGLLRAVAMSMAKNTKLFHRLPSGSFGLLEWYPAIQDGRTGSKAKPKGRKPAMSARGKAAKRSAGKSRKPKPKKDDDESSGAEESAS